MVLSVGGRVEAFSFVDQSGKEWSYPSDFSGGKVALFFLRHLGCPLCKMKIDELKAAHQSFQDKNVKLFAVVQSTEKRARTFSEKAGLPYPLVPDREKRLYEMFGVRKGGLKEYTAPAAFMATVRATFKGHMHGAFEGDEFQVPAAFVLSGDGSVIWAHYGKDISDFGGVEEALANS